MRLYKQNILPVIIIRAVALLWLPSFLSAQSGRLLTRSPYLIADSVKQARLSRNPSFRKVLDSTTVDHITYQSDGLAIAGFIARPVAMGKYPCIIFCRGGYADFGALDDWSCMLISEIASHGYIVVASQYRGGPGSGGMDGFGGDDVHDVLNCLPVLAGLTGADTARIGMWGVSRGGMMVYKALTSLTNIRAAVVVSGVANMYDLLSREDSAGFVQDVFMHAIPDYAKNKDDAFRKRSASSWPEKICSSTALLIMQGSSDWRVPARGPLQLALGLEALQHPVRFVLFEGGTHGLREFPEKNEWIWDWLDKYVKYKSPLPNMGLHD